MKVSPVKASPQAPELTAAGDRYFDGMAEKFARSLYNAPRGELRLALLDALLPEMLTLSGQLALDVGGGLGQQAAWLARRGHHVTLAEPSGDMLALARATLADETFAERIDYLQAPLQALDTAAPGPWPLVICHAVLEWMGDPRAALEALGRLVAPGGQLSLMVFNRDALRFANVIKGNRQKALDDRLEGLGKRKRLTPVSPLTHAQIEHFAAAAGLTLDGVAGIRIFQDYLREPVADADDQATLFALERQYCRTDPHWRLGRYLLYTLRKPPCVNQ